MHFSPWFKSLSRVQRKWLYGTVLAMIVIVVCGVLLEHPAEPEKQANYTVDMSIREIAPKLGVTGKAMARELDLPLDVSNW